MQVCLVSPGTATQWTDPEVALSRKPLELAAFAPLGPLSLAAVLMQAGHSVSLVDTNSLYFEYLGSDESRKQAFSDFVVDRLRHTPADVFGFSTICSSYPLTLRLTERLRAARPGVPIVLGGPQASVVDRETLLAFPAVDIIVRGEAEQSFPWLLDRLKAGTDLRGLTGISFRDGMEICQASAAPLLENLDALPLPAYELYAHFDPHQPLALELGRGCPFGCTFCSTNDFFRRRFRLKSPARLIEEMSTLVERYATPAFELVHDMFTVDRKRVVAFCEALLACGRRFVWNCSARTDCVDEALLELMQAAGCNGIFFGVESGSPRIQKIIGKRLDLDEARRNVRRCASLGMNPTISTIIGFPEETREDLLQSVDVFADACCFDGAEPQMHLLAPLAGTPVQKQHAGRLELDDLFSDMSHQGWSQDPADRVMIAAYPEIFPNFYSLPSHVPRQFVTHLRNILMFGHAHFRWLLVALIRGWNFLEIVDRWLEFAGGESTPRSSFSAEHYYGSRMFAARFVEFVGQELLPETANPEALEALIEYSSAFISAEDSMARTPVQTASPERPIAATDVVEFPSEVHLLELRWEVDPVLQALRNGARLPVPVRRDSLVLLHRERERLKAWHQPPLAANILRCIDGLSPVGEQARRFAQSSPNSGFNAYGAYFLAMDQFAARKWVRIAAVS